MVFNAVTRALAEIVERLQERSEKADAPATTRQLEILEAFLDGRENEALRDAITQDLDRQDPEQIPVPGETIASLLGELPEESQEAIINDLQPDDLGNAEEIRQSLQEAEGSAIGQAGVALIGSLALEAASVGQIESQQFLVSQIMTFLALEDVLGKELEVTVGEGVQPRLEQEINAEYRSKQVNLQDVVEQSLRNKDSDEDYLQDISTYGIKPEEESILEEVAINDMEFEELIETPAELGLIVPDEILRDELDRSGYAEPTKEFLEQVNGRIRRSARAYQELIVSEDLISDLDTRVEDGTLTPDEAVELIPDEVDVDEDALLRRFQDKRDLDPQQPTRAQILSSVTEGYSDLETARERLDVAQLDTERYDDVLRAEIVGDLDGSLQEAVATGRLSETDYANLAEFAGFDDEVIDALLAGQSFSDLVDERLPLNQRPQDRSVETIVDIGGARTRGLENAGIGTVGALADADPEVVAEAAAVNDELAQTVIERAQRRLGRR